ncbi:MULTISPECIES: hypothetical protein [Bacillus]|uniref:hypothetical protein n=1 Tax=Bacillus TaxID=1386 RepID=UPI0005912191|nr:MULTISPECIES: hypothetical protein [Bacillus]AJE78168.1 hypothetical protein OY17_08730 [Bacillus sp. BH072]MEC5258504.1 hypothetical protein [Bacillus amyloliquefaciens]MED1922955.1 hypothetical protein [Bacillus velezensis]QHQ58364.1 hypothetical protein GWK37_15225 [Bacillus velezensis]WHM03082.1 hypothetical protein QLX50_05880 [Bacillus velezensis]
MQVRYVRTIVGWFNVYPAGTDRYVNLKPEDFFTLLPQVSQLARSGCGEITATAALELFGEQEVLPA